MRADVGRARHRALGLVVCVFAMCAAAAPGALAASAPPGLPQPPADCPPYQNTGVIVPHCLVNYPGVTVTVSPQIVRVGQVISVTEHDSFPFCDAHADNKPCRISNTPIVGVFLNKLEPGDQVPPGPMPTFASGGRSRLHVPISGGRAVERALDRRHGRGERILP